MDQSPGLDAMRGEMPRTTHDEMQLSFCRQFDEFARLAGGECHRLFEQNMQSTVQRGFGLGEMDIRRRSHHHRIKLFEREYFPHTGAGVLRAKVAGNALRFGPLATLHGNQPGLWMRIDGGNMGGGRPPACANYTNANFVHISKNLSLFWPGENFFDRVEITAAVLLRWFEATALGPLIPGIDGDDFRLRRRGQQPLPDDLQGLFERG